VLSTSTSRQAVPVSAMFPETVNRIKQKCPATPRTSVRNLLGYLQLQAYRAAACNLKKRASKGRITVKQKKEQKKRIEKVEKQLREAKIVAPSSAAAQVAAFLVKNYPKDALRIAAGMESASDGKSMRRRMGRIKKEVASASASS
jgi:hypothetical protein